MLLVLWFANGKLNFNIVNSLFFDKCHKNTTNVLYSITYNLKDNSVNDQWLIHCLQWICHFYVVLDIFNILGLFRSWVCLTVCQWPLMLSFDSYSLTPFPNNNGKKLASKKKKKSFCHLFFFWRGFRWTTRVFFFVSTQEQSSVDTL